MKVKESIHTLEIPLKIQASPERHIDRLVFAYLIFGKKITLLDSEKGATQLFWGRSQA